MANPFAPLQGPPAPDAIPLGRYSDWDTGLIGERLRWNQSEGVLLFGPMGSGKDTRLLDQLLLQTSLSSIVVLDVKGESAAKTAAYRRTLGPVHIINPTGMLVDHPGYVDPNTGIFHDYKDLVSGGFNPFVGIDGSPDNPHLVGEAQILADALIEQPKERDKNSYFSEGAANIWAVAIVLELLKAKAEDRPPSMARIRAMVCQESGEEKGKPYGWPAIAKNLSERAPVPALRNLVGQLRNFQSDIVSMHSEAMGQTKRFDDPLFARDMEGWTFDVRDIKRQPTTVYIMIPAEMLASHSRYLRLLITKIMRAVMRPRLPGEPRVIMALNESYALGRIDYLRQQWSLVRGYGVTTISAWQSLTQMHSVWGEAEANTMSAAAGIVASFRPADIKTAKFLSELCGETTVVVRGYNEGQQQNAASQGSSTGLSLTQHKVPAMQPQALFAMKDGQLLMISKTDLPYYITAYAPSYWQIDECNARVRANPYNPESIPTGPMPTVEPPSSAPPAPRYRYGPGLIARLYGGLEAGIEFVLSLCGIIHARIVLGPPPPLITPHPGPYVRGKPPRTGDEP